MQIRNIEWKTAHLELQKEMQKEIEIMRHVLSNLHEEEISLIHKDELLRKELLEKRAGLMGNLALIRQTQKTALERLHGLNPKEPPIKEARLENVLSVEDQESCETFLLRDQILALNSRMHLQLSRNEALEYVAKNYITPTPRPMSHPKRHKRVMVEEESSNG